MPKTLLAVDDSATMRKVLEITFAGEDFRVLTAEGSQKALAHRGCEGGVIEGGREGHRRAGHDLRQPAPVGPDYDVFARELARYGVELVGAPPSPSDSDGDAADTSKGLVARP